METSTDTANAKVSDKTCPFCQILENDKLHQIIKRGKNFTAIKKLYKSKNVNFLIISHDHIENLKVGNPPIDLNDLRNFVNILANGKDYSIKISNGKRSGQEVFHFHAHINSYDTPGSWGREYL